MINILHITGSLEQNGTETFIMNVYRRIDRTKFNFDFLIHDDSKSGYYNEVKELGGSIYYVPPRRNSLLRYYSNLKCFMRNNIHKYDVVHYSSCNLTSILPIYLAKKYGCSKIIVHSHSTKNISGLHNYILHKINRLFINSIMTQAIGCSSEASKWFFGQMKARNNSLILRNGIDVSNFIFNSCIRSQYRKCLNIEDKLVIGNISRFDTVKNHKFILQVFSEILKLNNKSILVLVGTGPLEMEIMSEARKLNIFDSCKFLGYRSDISSLLNSFDVILFPSLFEGIPFSLIEAQASGLPVFTSTNVSELVKITDLVRFLPLDLPLSIWAQNIVKSYNSDSSRTKYNKQVTSAGYDISETVKLLEQIYYK